MLQETMIFVWRCPDCPEVYDGKSLSLLYTDGDSRNCSCGGRLFEGVAPGGAQRYQLSVPEYLRGTSLHRQLEELLASEEGVEITPGRPKDRHINLFSYAD